MIRRKYRILIILSLLMFVGPRVESQEEGVESRTPQWANTLQVIKGDIQRIMEENQKLQEEYDTLKEELINIQTTINTYKIENRDIENDIERTKKLITQEGYTRDALQQKMERLKQEALANQSKTDALKGQLGSLDEKLRLWQLQINDLELEKKQLDLELQTQEKLRMDIESGEAEELKKLRDQIAATQEESAEVSRSADALASQNQQVLAEITRLREENEQLEKQISQLEDEKKLKIKETQRLRESVQASTPSKEYDEKLKKKKALENEISQLEGQLESVKKSVEESAAMQSKKRGLLDQIMSLDRENRELRKKIADLRARMATIKQDPSKFNQ